MLGRDSTASENIFSAKGLGDNKLRSLRVIAQSWFMSAYQLVCVPGSVTDSLPLVEQKVLLPTRGPDGISRRHDTLSIMPVAQSPTPDYSRNLRLILTSIWSELNRLARTWCEG